MIRQAEANDFQGMNQRQDIDKIPVNTSPLLVNIDLSNPGTWKKRKGTSLIGGQANLAEDVLGLSTYYPKSGMSSLRAFKPNQVTPVIIAQSNGTEATAPNTSIAANWRLAQSFTATVNGDLKFVEVFGKVNKTGTFSYQIRSDSGTTPEGSLISEGIFTASNTTAQWISISIYNTEITSASKYWIVINPIDNDAVFTWYFNDTSIYANGEGLANQPYPNTWIANDGTSDIGDFVVQFHQYTSISSLYTLSSNKWTETDADIITNNTRVQSVNFLNRMYHVAPNLFLSYETGGALTDVGTGSDRIKGNSIAVAQNTLFVGGDIDNPDRVYYSLFDLDTNSPDDQLWEDTEGTLADSTRWFSVNGKVQALYTYSPSGRVFAFSENEGFTFDVAAADNAYGVQKRFNVGCANPRAITEVNNWLVWMSKDARVWAWGGSGPSLPLSWDIEDDTSNESIIKAIDTNDIDKVASGSLGNKFYFSVGDVNILNRDIENAVLVGLVSQNFGYVLWSIYSFPTRPVVFSKTIIGNKEVLVFGGEDGNVYQMDSGLNDDTIAINSYALTSSFRFGSAFSRNNINELTLKYRPQPAEDTFLYVKYALDSNLEYSTVSDPDNGEQNYAVIDMYDANASTLLDAVGRLGMPSNARGRTISFELGNNQLDESFEIKGIRIGYTQVDNPDINTRA